MSDDFDFSWEFCEFCSIDHINDRKECSDAGMKVKINSLKGEVANLESELGETKKTLKEANGILTKFANPDDKYWIEKTTEYDVKEADGKVRKEKVHHMKSVIQLTKMPFDYLLKLKGQSK
jgi:hypothetical protein